jgi:hypothetical protein
VSDAQVTLVYLCLEVAGCPTVCRHCWAQGTGYGMMPLADIEWVLARAHDTPVSGWPVLTGRRTGGLSPL